MAYYLFYRGDDDTDTYKLTTFFINNFFLLATLFFDQPNSVNAPIQVPTTQSDMINVLINNQDVLHKFYGLVMTYWDQVKSQI